jgi:hypothetical protein
VILISAFFGCIAQVFVKMSITTGRREHKSSQISQYGDWKKMSNEKEDAKITKSSLGWIFGMQLIVIFAIIKLFGLLGGLVAWGLWHLVAFLIKRYK